MDTLLLFLHKTYAVDIPQSVCFCGEIWFFFPTIFGWQKHNIWAIMFDIQYSEILQTLIGVPKTYFCGELRKFSITYG